MERMFNFPELGIARLAARPRRDARGHPPGAVSGRRPARDGAGYGGLTGFCVCGLVPRRHRDGGGVSAAPTRRVIRVIRVIRETGGCHAAVCGPTRSWRANASPLPRLGAGASHRPARVLQRWIIAASFRSCRRGLSGTRPRTAAHFGLLAHLLRWRCDRFMRGGERAGDASQRGDFTRRQFAPAAGRQLRIAERADADAAEREDGVTDGLAHPADLTIASFANRHLGGA